MMRPIGLSGLWVVSLTPAQRNHSQANRDHNGGSDSQGGRIGHYCQQQGDGGGGEGGGHVSYATTPDLSQLCKP